MNTRRWTIAVATVFVVIILIWVSLNVVQNRFDEITKGGAGPEGSYEDYLQADIRMEVGSEGFIQIIYRTDHSRQMHYVGHVCVATGEIMFSRWVGFNQVDLGIILN